MASERDLAHHQELPEGSAVSCGYIPKAPHNSWHLVGSQSCLLNEKICEGI